MRLFVTLVLLHVLQGAVQARKRSASRGCSINTNTDLPQNEPVMLIVSGKSPHLALSIEDTVKLQLNEGEQMVLACPGRSNKMEKVQGTPISLSATCGNSNIKVNQSNYSLKDLGCTNKVSGDIYNTEKTCGPKHAVMLQLGYLIEDKWYPVFSVCHIKNRSTTLFSKHIIHGKQMKEAGKQSTVRPYFQVGGDYYPGFSPEQAYRKSVQKNTLKKILNSTELAQKYMSTTYIARGHLAPDADFVLHAYQCLTYFYVNTAPQWQSVNAGNWLSLENTIRKLAKANEVDLDITTGTYDVLKLEADSGRSREIYLYYNTSHNSQLPIPKYFWKVAYNNATKEGIAFVALNNPFITKVTLNDILCTNICEQAGWMPTSKVWQKFTNGYLYCCEVNALRKTISYVPRFNISGILQGPN
ncbi:uncharacterized protein [Anabrus simplex]|uniref:uncharacterized protein n=1 Tax=Anabrus simplex TaxID=316456 RepID=UPI0035A382F1